MSKYFEGIDFDNFWNNQKYYLENCVGNKLDDETIRYVEKELGYKLPESYIELMKIQNGGAPIKNTWINKDAKPNEVDTVVMTNFYSVGSEKADSLLGKFGNKFWFTEWEYPNIGVVIAETISGGHQLIYLDYSECANNGIPKVAMINQESDYHKTILSNTFEDFVLSLIEEDELYDDECDKLSEAEIKQKNLNDFIEHTKQTLAEINEDYRKMYKNIVNMGYNYLKYLYERDVDKGEIYNFLIGYKEELDTGIAKEYIEDLIKIVVGDCEESKVLWK